VETRPFFCYKPLKKSFQFFSFRFSDKKISNIRLINEIDGLFFIKSMRLDFS